MYVAYTRWRIRHARKLRIRSGAQPKLNIIFDCTLCQLAIALCRWIFNFAGLFRYVYPNMHIAYIVYMYIIYISVFGYIFMCVCMCVSTLSYMCWKHSPQMTQNALRQSEIVIIIISFVFHIPCKYCKFRKWGKSLYIMCCRIWLICFDSHFEYPTISFL